MIDDIVRIADGIDGQLFLPCEQAFPVHGDLLRRWLTPLANAHGERRELFRQSNFFGAPL
jgi:hypothetical protein